MSETPARLSLVHQLRAPAQPAGPRHPTVLALHGRGSDGADMLSLAPYLDERLLWVVPRAPLYLEGGFEWYRVPHYGAPEQVSFEAAVHTLARFVEEISEAYPADPQKLYLLGFSQGAMLAYSYLLSHPQRVAGVIAHSGYLPLKALETAGPIETAGVRGKPVFIAHGLHDSTIPIAWARAARDYFTAAEAEVAYYEFPMAHTVSDRSLAVMDAWLQQQLERTSGS